MRKPSARSYLLTGLALLTFLALTITAAYMNLGPLNTIVAMSISVAKSALIVLLLHAPALQQTDHVGVCRRGILLAGHHACSWNERLHEPRLALN